jgi:hypothetical protein
VQVEFANALADATRWDRASEAFQAILSRHPGNREAMFGVLSVLARRTPPVSEPNASDANLRMLRAAVDALLGKLSEDSVMLCLSGERLAQSGHYEMATNCSAPLPRSASLTPPPATPATR